jgi:hypothetical protein
MPWFRERRDTRLARDVIEAVASAFDIAANRWARFADLPCHPIIAGSAVMSVARYGKLFHDSDLDIFVAEQRVPLLMDISTCDFDALTTSLARTKQHHLEQHERACSLITARLGFSAPVKNTRDPGYRFELHDEHPLDARAWVYRRLHSSDVPAKINIIFAEVTEPENENRTQIHDWIRSSFDTTITTSTFDGRKVNLGTNEQRAQLALYQSEYRSKVLLPDTPVNADKFNHLLNRVSKYTKRGVVFPRLLAVDGPVTQLLHTYLRQGQLYISEPSALPKSPKRTETLTSLTCWKELRLT